MADQRAITSVGPYILRVQAGKLFLSNEVAQKIENMYPLEEGSLRTVWGPAAYVPVKETSRLDGGMAPTSAPLFYGFEVRTETGFAASISNPLDKAIPTYGRLNHGIFHCLLQRGERDVLLLHTGNELWEFRGWKRNWRQLLSDPSSTVGLRDRLPDDSRARYPTQFEATGNGVVIVPQDRQAYFYDGITIAPLGFSEIPSAPIGRGPEDSKGFWDKTSGEGVNDRAYTHDGIPQKSRFGGTAEMKTGMTRGFGVCRIGTVVSLQSYDFKSLLTSGSAGWLEDGEWRCAVQFIDKWGNLSPVSGRSNPVTVTKQPSLSSRAIGIGDEGENGVGPLSTLLLRKQFAWTGIPTGPEHTIGRILYRTKDVNNSGSTKLYDLPQDSLSVSTPFATLPDNVTTMYPDNIPDSWLIIEAPNIDPVPRFKLCRVAFGRLWIANMEDAPGMIRPSMPNKWGTFPRGKEMYPDPAGGEVTGLWRVPRGLLAFTANSSFLIEASDDGASFKSAPLSAEVGCEAPNSLQTLADGRVIWLGKDGFYLFDGTKVYMASATIRRTLRRATRARMKQACAAFDPRSKEYRCWISIDGSIENNMCFIFDGTGWRQRTDTEARDVCVTRDHRHYMLVAGTPPGLTRAFDSASTITRGPYNGVWLLDHTGNLDDAPIQNAITEREATIETAWMEAPTSRKAKSVSTVYLWLRETEDSTVSVEVLRDWRNTVIETVQAKTYSGEDVPAFWGKTQFDSGAKWVRRRPFWTRVQIYVPSAETFKFRIKGKGFWEFVGVTVDEALRYAGGAHIPP